MNIFNKITLQGLKKNRTRTFVTIIGVILSSALITAIGTFAVSLQNYTINGAIMKYGNWHVGFAFVTSSFVQEQLSDSRVKNIVTFENIGYAPLEGGTNEDKPYLFIAGFHEETFDTLPVNLIAGRLPEQAGEVIVPTHVASNGGVSLEVGDVITLRVGTRQSGEETLNQHIPYRTGEETLNPAFHQTYTVVGIYQRPSFEEFSAPGYTVITTANTQASPDSLTAFVTLKNPYLLPAYIKNNSEHNIFLNDDVLRFMGLSGSKLFTTLLYSAGGTLTALIMLGSVFMIYNSFHISLNERIRQFGVLMSVGATAKQLRHSVLFEGFCIGTIGIPIGILAGIPSMGFVLTLVAENFANTLYDNVPLTLTVSVPIIVAAVVISMITILISAYIPARKAVRTPIMECIRQTGEIKITSHSVKTSKLAERIYGLEGTLALKNFKRNRRRYCSIILSLTLSVVLFVSASSFGTYLNMITQLSVVDIDYDICFYTTEMDKNEMLALYDSLKTVDGVYESLYSDDSSQVTGLSDVPETICWVMLFRSTNPGQSTSQMQQTLEGLGITSKYTLHNFHAVFEQNRNLLFVVNLFTAVFVIMISLIAVANVFNTISTNIRLRRRELAMIRSVGMSDHAFNKMMGFECIFYGLRTLLFALPVSGILSWLIYMAFTGGRIEGADGMHFVFPWSSIGISLCGVFLVIFITTLYTVSQIKKENIIDTLRTEE